MTEGEGMVDTRQTKKRPATVALEPAAPAKAPRKQASGHSTSLDIPHYVMDQVRDYLADHRDIKFRNMVLLGFTKLGLQIEPEDLKPERQRGVS